MRLTKLQIISVILTIISTTLGLFLKFVDIVIDSSKVNYFLFALKQLYLEFIIIGLIIFIIAFYKIWIKQIKLKISKYNTETTTAIYIIMALSIILFIVFGNVFGVFKSRYFFYTNSIYKAYKNELYLQGRIAESNIDFDKAIEYYKLILEKFPQKGGNNAIERRLNELESRKNLSKQYYELSKINKIPHHFSRDSWYYLVKSYAVNPSNKQLLNEIIPRKYELEKGINSYNDFYTSVIENDVAKIDSLCIEYSWVYFENNIKNKFLLEEYNKTNINYKVLYKIISCQNPQDMVKIMRRSWRLEELETILSND